MILSGSSLASVGSCKTKQYNTVSSCTPRTISKFTSCSSRTFSKVTFPNISCSWTQYQGLKYPSSRGSPHSSLLTIEDPKHFSRTTHIISPLRLNKRRSETTPQAFILEFFKFKKIHPPMEEKPKFWWRVLASLAYFMPLHEAWMYAETAYNLHPFLETLEFMCYPFLRAVGSLPRWSLMAYFFSAYLGIVRQPIWPHFFRYHVVLGMLLEITLQVTGITSRWLPKALLWGKLGMHFWCFVGLSFLFTVMECIRCCVCGMYADVPLLSSAAYVQIPQTYQNQK